MRLSVLIPLAAGDGDGLAGTLESLATQPADLAEILVLGDAGDATSAKLVEDFSQNLPGRLRYVECPVGPPVDRWNAGVAASGGDWVSFVRPGVTVRPGFTQALGESAGRCQDAGLIRAGWTRARAGGGQPEQHTLLSVRTVTHPAEALYEQRFGPKASTAASAVSRKVWDLMGGLAREITLVGDWIGDWALWLRAGACAETVRSPEVVADIHWTQSSSKAQEARELYLIYRDVLPAAVAAAGIADATWIAAASRKRFRDVAIAASNEVQPANMAEREVLFEALLPWAEAVEQLPLLERFRAGEKVRSFAFASKVRPTLRRVVAVVR